MIAPPDQIQTYLSVKYPRLSKNKHQEITRLLYEIAKREHLHYTEILNEFTKPTPRFIDIKDYLVKRRFPNATKNQKQVSPLLPSLTIDPQLKVNTSRPPSRHPQKFYVEENVLSSELVERVRDLYPRVPMETITAYRNHTKAQSFGIKDYNQRLNAYYLIQEKYDFYKRCPCSNNSIFCGYHIVNLGSGCAYECAYCVLQDYINSPGIVLPANLEDFFNAFQNYQQNIRVGSGEWTDSLLFDHVTGYSPRIVEFFRKHPKSQFEFKTKSANIDLLLTVAGADNVVISWSMNPSKVTETIEHFTASTHQRLIAAQRCAEHGYRVAFHFDPIIHYQGWKNDYEELVNLTFDLVPEEQIAWMSIGTLRLTPRLKKIIENRFPETSILDEEMLPGHDGKLRYSNEARNQIYQNMTQWIRKRSQTVKFYLCMEDKEMCQTHWFDKR